MNDKISYKDLQTPYVAKMLTTVDNPYDPFEKFDDWYRYDIENGYNTCGLIARLLPNSRDFNVLESNEEINSVIDRIIQLDPLNQYVIVAKKIVPEFLELEEIINK